MFAFLKLQAQKAKHYMLAYFDFTRVEITLAIETQCRYVQERFDGVFGKPIWTDIAPRHIREPIVQSRPTNLVGKGWRSLPEAHFAVPPRKTFLFSSGEEFMSFPEKRHKLRSLKHNHYPPQTIPNSISSTIPESSSSYIEGLRSLFPPKDTAKERWQHIQQLLTPVLGQHRMQASIGSNSGHSGIHEDPVLSRHFYENKQSALFEAYDQWCRDRQGEQRRQEIHIAELQAERQKLEIILEYALVAYERRIEKLVSFGPMLDLSIRLFTNVIQNDDLEGFSRWAMHTAEEILQPSYAILQEMRNEIALEQLGAAKIKESWHLDGIEYMHGTLRNLIDISPNDMRNDLMYLIEGIEAICKPLSNALPFKNPIPELSSVLPAQQHTQISFETFLASLIPPPQQPPKSGGFSNLVATQPIPSVLVTAPAEQQAEQSEKTDKEERNYPSFAALTAARKAEKSEDSAPSVLVTALASEPSASTASNEAKAALLRVIDEITPDFILNVQIIESNDGYINRDSLKEVLSAFHKMKQITKNAKGIILKDDEGSSFRIALSTLKEGILTLCKREREGKEVRSAKAYADNFQKLWSQ